MRINWDAPTIIAYAEGVRILKMNFNPTRVPSYCFVHGIVDDFGEEMMQSLFVRAADIHTGPLANRLQSLEDLDLARSVVATLLLLFVGHLCSDALCDAMLRPIRSPPERKRCVLSAYPAYAHSHAG